MYAFLKPFLFLFSPEKAHRLAMIGLDLVVQIPFLKSLIRRWYVPNVQRAHSVQVMGLHFQHCVGLAAGFDKDAEHIEALADLGFAFIEVGTVTPKPQAGNPRPRLFRLPDDEALINRMGFNNQGLEALVNRLKNRKDLGNVVIGGNIGKNKATPNEEAEADYLACFEALHPWVHYFVVNVSSPNTPGLRELQEKEPLTRLLNTLQSRNRQLAEPRPILLKIAPDLTEPQIDEIAEIVTASGLAGVIATNTTIARTGLVTPADQVAAIGAGGLSGAPLRNSSTGVIRQLRRLLGPEAVIIGVGGIDSAEAAREKLEAGANLVQVYTGFIYKGPAIVRNIVSRLY